MNKRCLSFVLALVMILTMVPMTAVAASADRFTDVTKDKWYYTFVDYVAEKGYFSGTSETKFSPDVTMTRAMFVTALANMESVTADNSKTAFTDVPAGKWYTGAAKWAVDNKILSGYSDGTFRPNAKITREEMCVIMSNYIAYHSEKNNVEHKKEGSTKAFSDASQISSWAKTAVADCRAYGLIDGFSDGTFRPKKESTRAEVAAVIYKLAWLVKEEPTTGGSSGGNRPSPTPIQTRTLRVAVEGELIAALNNVGTNAVAESKNYSLSDSAYNVLTAMLNQACDQGYIARAYNKAIDEAERYGVLEGNVIKGIPYTVPRTEMVSAIVDNPTLKTALMNKAAEINPALAGQDDQVQGIMENLLSGTAIEANLNNKAVLTAMKEALNRSDFVDKVGDLVPAGYETILTDAAIEDARDQYLTEINNILARPEFSAISPLAEGSSNATLGSMKVYLDVYQAMLKSYNVSKSRLETIAAEDGALDPASETGILVAMAHPDHFINVSGTTQTLAMTTAEQYHTYLTSVMAQTKAALDENRRNTAAITAIADFVRDNFHYLPDNTVTITIDGVALDAEGARMLSKDILTKVSDNTDLTMEEWLENVLGYTVSDYSHLTNATNGYGTIVLESDPESLGNTGDLTLPPSMSGGQIESVVNRFFHRFQNKLQFKATIYWDIDTGN